FLVSCIRKWRRKLAKPSKKPISKSKSRPTSSTSASKSKTPSAPVAAVKKHEKVKKLEAAAQAMAANLSQPQSLQRPEVQYAEKTPEAKLAKIAKGTKKGSTVSPCEFMGRARTLMWQNI
ncbi:hypothetical protein ANCCAN_18186, partial [Ancylostoma caninum]